MPVFPGIFSAGRRQRPQNSEESNAPAAGGPIIFEAGFLPITSRSGFGLMLPTPCIPPRWPGRRSAASSPGLDAGERGFAPLQRARGASPWRISAGSAGRS